MAEGNNVICRFFATTGCREGDKCTFSHDPSNTIHDSVCRFYMIGKCVYGIQCRYTHVRPSPSSSTSSKSARDGRSLKTVPTRSDEVRFAKPCHNLPTNRMLQLKAAQAAPIDPNWVNAPEFVPKTRKSYADTLKPEENRQNAANCKRDKRDEILCPYFLMGDCPHNDRCNYVHGEKCDICGRACLLPFDKEQQRVHKEECEKELEENMELSFAVQRSEDKTCGICFDVIMEKEGLSERRFGILEKCNHVFCLTCIRKWRQVKRGESQYGNQMMDPVMTRACPECRVPSDFITPSQYWVDNEVQKKKLISDYKEAMRKKPCRYFDQGRGSCPFQGACFYKHAYPDGRIADMPLPQPRRRQNQNGIMDLVNQVYLWDFLSLRDESFIFSGDSDEFYDLSDSDDSDRLASIFS